MRPVPQRPEPEVRAVRTPAPTSGIESGHWCAPWFLERQRLGRGGPDVPGARSWTSLGIWVPAPGSDVGDLSVEHRHTPYRPGLQCHQIEL